MGAVVDFGLYDALRGRDDFAQQRADAQQNAMYIGLLQQQAGQKLKAQQEAQQGVADHINAANAAITQALPGDKERIQDFVAKQKQPLVDAIAKYGGDLDRWKQNGGNLDLDQFENTLKTGTDERGVNPIANAVANMNAARLAMADNKSGLEYNSNPDGTPFDLNGQLQKLKNGQIATIQYPGAYKPEKYNINDLENRYGANPYLRQGITKPEVIADMAQQGLHPEQIRKDLPKFFDPSGKPLFFHRYDKITPEQQLQMRKTQLEIKDQENKNAFDENKEEFAKQKWGQVQNVLQGNNYEPFSPNFENLDEAQIPSGTTANTELAGTVISANIPQYKFNAKGSTDENGNTTGGYVLEGTKNIKVPIKDVLKYPDGRKFFRVEDAGKIYTFPVNEQNAFSNIMEPYAKNIGNYDEMLRAGIKKRILTNNGFDYTGQGNQGNMIAPQNQSKPTEGTVWNLQAK